jgi:DNA-binding PadR family transcriptional regulator
MAAASSDVSSSSPLTPIAFHVLVSLAEKDRHGYAIMQEVAERTSGEVRLQAGTLYATIKRLLADGSIEELQQRPRDEDDDARRRYYRLTRTGRRAVSAEAERLAALVRQARAFGLIRGAD